MKRLLLIAAILISCLDLKASHLSSELILKLQDQSVFSVNIDNRGYSEPQKRIHIHDLEPGRHLLTVIRFSPYHSYQQTVFNGFIEIPVRSKVFSMIDRHHRFRINNIIALGPLPVVHPPVYYPIPYVAPPLTAMNDYEFDQLRNSIDRMDFESSKYQVAKQAISVNHVSARQVAELMKLMTFESTKLDLAKFAYNKTIDKQNYFIINNEFTFESSISDLNEYIYRG